MTDLVLDDLDPRMFVSANKRIHYRVRSEVCAYWRQLARTVALREYGHADEGCTWHRRVNITITYRFPSLIRRDVGNFYPYVAKPIVDGLVDAQVIPDDDDRHVTGPDARRDFERGPHRIVLTIEEAP